MRLMPDPGTSARRSRRGYYYQDVCALQRCIDMLDGLWKSVTLEGDEDIILVRTRPAGRKYCQVKTVEGPSQLWTAARLCRPEVVAQPATSILGRLFTSRPVPRDAVLELVLNEEVDAKLRPLCTSPAASPEATIDIQADLAGRLSDLALPDERPVRWYVDRLQIDIRERTADAMEDVAFRRLAVACAARSSKLLPEELDVVLERILNRVCRASRGAAAMTVDRATFSLWLDEYVAAAIRRIRDSATPDAGRLTSKLSDAEQSAEAIEHALEMHVAFRRAVRSSVGERHTQLNQLFDLVFIACSYVAAKLATGDVRPGAAAYAATLDRIQLALSADATMNPVFGMVDAVSALFDITARCRHRFV
jgi:hypothetical protein